MVRLARALHYAQDGSLSKSIVVEGLLRKYEYREDDMHNIYEKDLSTIIGENLKNFDIQAAIQEGLNKALKEKPFKYDEGALKRTETILIETLKAMHKLTAYTLVKFIEIIRYVKRNREKILKLNKIRKILAIIGITEIMFVGLLSPYYLQLQSVFLWLILAGIILLVTSIQIHEHIKPALLLIKEDGEYKKYVEWILEERVEKDTRTVTRVYIPVV